MCFTDWPKDQSLHNLTSYFLRLQLPNNNGMIRCSAFYSFANEKQGDKNRDNSIGRRMTSLLHKFCIHRLILLQRIIFLPELCFTSANSYLSSRMYGTLLQLSKWCNRQETNLQQHIQNGILPYATDTYFGSSNFRILKRTWFYSLLKETRNKSMNWLNYRKNFLISDSDWSFENLFRSFSLRPASWSYVRTECIG